MQIVLVILFFCSILLGQAGGGVTAYPNDASTGTTINQLAKINASGNLIVISTSDTNIPVYIVASGAGKSGMATVQVSGSASCSFDGAGTIGHYVVASSSTAGLCSDAGATAPPSRWIIGQLQTTTTSGGVATVALSPGYSSTSGGGAGNAGAVVQYTPATSLTLTCPSATASTVVTFEPTYTGTTPNPLTGGVTTVSLSGCPGSSSLSAQLNFVFVQVMSGTLASVTMPTGFTACALSQTFSVPTVCSYSWDGTTGYQQTDHVQTGAGYCGEQSAPSTPISPTPEATWCDSTLHAPRARNSSGNYSAMAFEGTGIRIGGGAAAADTFVTPDTNPAHALCGGSTPAFGTGCVGGGGGGPIFDSYVNLGSHTCSSSNGGQVFYATAAQGTADVTNKHWVCDGSSTWQPIAFDMHVVEPPAISAWTTVNGTNTMVSDDGVAGAVEADFAFSGAGGGAMLKAIPGSTYTLEFEYDANQWGLLDTGYIHCGFAISNGTTGSSTDEVLSVNLGTQNVNGPGLSFLRYGDINNSTPHNLIYASGGMVGPTTRGKLVEDGTHRTWYLSIGGNYKQIYQEATNTNLTPSYFGFACTGAGSGDFANVMIYSWYTH